MTRMWPISRRNSTVLGADARGSNWDVWWNRGARWDAAYPTKPIGAVLNVPCMVVWERGARWWDGTEVYRVRPKNDRGRPVRRDDGVWCWRYPAPRRRRNR